MPHYEFGMLNLKYLAFILLSIASINVYAQDLYFAGFSFIGDTSEDNNYPIAAKLYKSENRLLDKQLGVSLKKLTRSDITIISDKLGIQRNGNAVALAYGLQKESFSEIQMEGGYQSKFEINGQIYVFDYSDDEHKLIVNYPTGIAITVTSYQKLTQQEIQSYFENMYVPDRNKTPYKITYENGSQSSNWSVFDDWVSRLDKVKIERAKKDNRLQIRQITLDEPVIRQINGDSAFIKDQKMLIKETARNFETYLTTYQNVPVLPYSVGNAIGKNMIARFAEADLKIKIPNPDYVVDILVREFKKTYVDNKVYDGFVYGAFVTLKVSLLTSNDSEHGIVKFESKFNYKDEIQLPKSYKLTINDPWPLWMGSQKKMFEILTKQISNRSEIELSRITNTPNIKETLKNFDDVVISCR